MAGLSVGTVTVNVIPTTGDFAEALAAQILPQTKIVAEKMNEKLARFDRSGPARANR